MMTEILSIFHDVRAEQKCWAPEDYPVRLSTWAIRVRLQEKFPQQHWQCHSLRPVLMSMPEIEKDEYQSRRGNAVWRLKP